MTAGNEASLWWTPPAGEPAATYAVYRAQTDSFVPSTANLVDTTADPRWSGQNVPTGTWYYRVVARDAAGNASAPTAAIRSVVSLADAATVARDDFRRSITGGWGTAPVGGSWSVSQARLVRGGSRSGDDHERNSRGGPDSLAGRQQRPGCRSDGGLPDRHESADRQRPDGQAADTAPGQLPRVPGDGVPQGRRDSEPRAAPHRVRAWQMPASPSPFLAGSCRGRDYAVRTLVTGANPTTLRAKVWDAATSEPAGWTATWTDSTASLQVAGDVGIASYISGSASGTPVTSGIDAVPRGLGPAAPSDTVAPSAPGTPSATVSGTTVAVAWGAATDNVGVDQYRVYRGTTLTSRSRPAFCAGRSQALRRPGRTSG